jgi:hypothetical protein
MAGTGGYPILCHSSVVIHPWRGMTWNSIWVFVQKQHLFALILLHSIPGFIRLGLLSSFPMLPGCPMLLKHSLEYWRYGRITPSTQDINESP